MNQQQKNYFLKRLEVIKNQKIAGMNDAFIVIPAKDFLNEKVKSKEISIKPLTDLDKIIKKEIELEYSRDYFSMSYGLGNIKSTLLVKGFDKVHKEYQDLVNDIKDSKDQMRRKIETKASKVADIVMFGEESEALEKLKEFEQFNYIK